MSLLLRAALVSVAVVMLVSSTGQAADPRLDQAAFKS
jgi:hypothetical protein